MPHLFYNLRTSEQRRSALNDVANLRVDPHVLTLDASPLMAAILDLREVGEIDISYRPGYDQPSFMTMGSSIRPFSLNESLPLSDLELPLTITDPEVGRRILETYTRFLLYLPGPIRNIESMNRHLFPVAPLPLPEHLIYFDTPNWPEWCREGVTVYLREDGYRPMTVTKVEQSVTITGGREDDEFCVFHPPDLVELVSPVKPLSSWDLLLDED